MSMIQKKDISDFLDEINLKLLSESDASYQSIEKSFTKTFKLINTTLGEKAFKKEQKGKFLESVFEAIAVGLSRNIDDYDDKNPNDITYLKGKIESLFQQDFYLQNAGSGSNAKSRINKMIPSSIEYFKRHE